MKEFLKACTQALKAMFGVGADFAAGPGLL